MQGLGKNLWLAFRPLLLWVGIHICLIACLVVAVMLKHHALGGDASGVYKELYFSDGRTLFLFVTISSLFSFIVVYLLVTRRRQAVPLLSLYPLPGARPVLLYISCGLVLNVFLSAGIDLLLSQGLYPEPPGSNPIGGVMAFSIEILVLVLLFPMMEEIMFRGILMKRLAAFMRPMPAVFLQAAVFSLFHMNIYQIPYTFVIGIVLGLVFLWSGSLWAPVLVHLANNILSVTLLRDRLTADVTMTAAAFALSATVLVVAAVYLYRNRIPSGLREPGREVGESPVTLYHRDLDHG